MTDALLTLSEEEASYLDEMLVACVTLVALRIDPTESELAEMDLAQAILRRLRRSKDALASPIDPD